MTDEHTFEVDPRGGLPRVVRTLVDVGLSNEDGESDRLRKRVLVLTTLTVVTVVAVWPITYALLGLFEAALVPALYVIATVVAFVVLVRTKNDTLLRNLQIVVLLLFPAVLQWILGGYLGGSAVVMFAVVAPVLSLMVVGRKQALVVLALVAVLAVGLGLADARIAEAAVPVPRGIEVGLMALNIIGVAVIVFFPLSFYITAFRGAYAALQAERLRAEGLIEHMLPASVASRLKAGERLIADELSDVVVLFADVVGFTSVTERLPAEQIVRRLNGIFTEFDRLTDEKGLDKIKTVGDSYMVAGGIAAGDGQDLQAMAELALAMRAASRDMSIDDAVPVQLRFGMDMGHVIAGVVGERMLAYDLYGDVVNTASRMASHGSPDRIHVTGRVRAELDGLYAFESRGGLHVKGKGDMETFFLERDRVTG